jgi:hypothetical protein
VGGKAMSQSESGKTPKLTLKFVKENAFPTIEATLKIILPIIARIIGRTIMVEERKKRKRTE